MTGRKVGEGMGRKPTSLVASEARGQSTGFRAIWEEIRKQRTFTANSLWLAIDKRRGGNIYTIRSYIQRLEKAGYVALDKVIGTRGAIQTKQFKLVRDIGVDAPRLTKEGQPSSTGLAHAQMWLAIRLLRDFTYRDLVINASTEEVAVKAEHARHYVAILAKAGYLAVVQERKHTVSLTRYRLLLTRDTGPKPPVAQKLEAVYDPNVRKIVWQQEPTE